MNKQFVPYYISRALLSAVFASYIVGFNWKAILITLVFFSFFLLYLHSGWFEINTENKLFPLRRDSRGQLIQRKALIIAIVLGVIAYFSMSLVFNNLGLVSDSGDIAFAILIIAYFSTQFVLFSKT